MKISSCGGVIAAANEKFAFPLSRVGNTTAVKRLVSCFQDAGIFPIVVISGAEEAEVRYQLSSSGVVFLRPGQSEPELFDSVKTGFSFLQDICGKIVFTPVNFPMFSPLTLRLLMETQGEIVSPSYGGKSGHPMLVSTKCVPEILAYQGGHGLRGAVDTLKSRRVWVDVDDPGILYTVRDGDTAGQRGGEVLRLAAEMSLKKDAAIFDARTKLLLLLIFKTRSVSAACEQMALSRSKAWEMLNALEDALETRLIERRHGGARGGRTTLSPQGLIFLREYQRLEESLHRHTQGKLEALKSLLQP